jgi:hypothetical protein
MHAAAHEALVYSEGAGWVKENWGTWLGALPDPGSRGSPLSRNIIPRTALFHHLAFSHTSPLIEASASKRCWEQEAWSLLRRSRYPCHGPGPVRQGDLGEWVPSCGGLDSECYDEPM